MDTIVVTPTWSGLLPALLDARGNIKRRLFADGCNFDTDKTWCDVHEAEVERESDTVCQYDPAKWAGARQGLFTELTNLDGEFAKMAKGADMSVAIQKMFDTAPATDREQAIFDIVTGGKA